jgi:hypothetical protein
MLFIDYPTVVQPLDTHRITLTAGQGCNPFAAGGIAGGLYHTDLAQRLAALKRFGYEQVCMGLQKPAGTELEDGRKT